VIPRLGISNGLHQYTQRRTTPRLQSIFPHMQADELDLYGVIRVTPREAHDGTRKLISIPQGSKKRTLLVTIPPGVQEGTRLRLKGLGQKNAGGNRADLFLEVQIMK
jgi:hypothetical protein